MIVQEGKVISILYSLRIARSDKLIASRLHKPLEFLVGKEELILGLEKELLGLQVGEKKKVRIAPENGYGLRDEKRIRTVNRSKISERVDVQEGMILKRKLKSGELMRGVVTSLDDHTVVVDCNHSLAGETLAFESEVLGIRDATKADYNKVKKMH